MILYRAEIRPLASFASPLQSDTFFGAFCWSYKYIYGEEALLELLQESLSGQPKIIFSNAFPTGYLPLPVGAYDTDRKHYGDVEKSSAKKVYQDNKKYKKMFLLERDAFRRIQQGERKGYSEYLGEEQTMQSEIVHNMISRDSGTTSSSKDEASLFVVKETFVQEGATFDVYIRSDLDEGILKRVLELMLELGIGADKSTGKGGFELLSLEEEKELDVIQGANGYVALSNFIPAANDPTEGWYKTFVKYGKLDREYASGDTPFKKPLLYIQAGAVFKTEDVKEYYGKCMDNISAIANVTVNACTIAVPIVIP